MKKPYEYWAFNWIVMPVLFGGVFGYVKVLITKAIGL